jgi:hypothetical protein
LRRYYLVEVDTQAQIDTFLSSTTALQRQRAFTIEFNSYQQNKWKEANLTKVRMWL